MVLDKSKKDKAIKKDLRKHLTEYMVEEPCLSDVPISVIGKFCKFCVEHFEKECFGIPTNVSIIDIREEMLDYVCENFTELRSLYFTEYYNKVKANFCDYIDQKLYMVLYGGDE